MVYEIQIEGAQPVQCKNEHDTPVFGTGQGSGNSPTIWTFISNILLKMMDQQAIGAQYYTHNKEDNVVKTTAYVDDVNTCHTSTQEMSLDEVMTQDYQQWESILRSSGGTLAPEKCNFYKLSSNFAPTGKPVLAENFQGTIDEHVDSIQQYGAHKSLGYMMLPTFGPKHQLQYWIEKENRFLQMRHNHPLTSSEVEILYKNIYIPTMQYIMPFTCTKKDHLQKVASKSITLFLKKFGYASTTSRDVVCGPTK
jgi:Reverse transcriptase (RNA-dependent DNA polymerase)